MALRGLAVGFLLLACMRPPPGAAQGSPAPYRLAGSITDPGGTPIPGVEVRATQGGPSTTSDSLGRFSLRLPRQLEWVVVFRRPGYGAQVISFKGDWTGTVVLQPGAVMLPDINVSARRAKPARYAATTRYDEFFVRARKGFGEFIGREAIDQRGAQHVAQMLEGRPGIRVSYQPDGLGLTNIYFARCNVIPPRINIYLDGRKMVSYVREDQESRIGDMLARIAIADVEMIEIYRGPGELPPEFNDGNCAAISIWTRTGGGS